MTPASIALAALVAVAAAAPTPSGLRLVAPPAPAADRLMGFTLRVKNGRVAGLPDWPAGWSASLDNDPNWSATLKAHATVGAAALPPSALGRLVELAAPPKAVAADLGSGPVSVSGDWVLMHGGELRTVKLRVIQVRPDRGP